MTAKQALQIESVVPYLFVRRRNAGGDADTLRTSQGGNGSNRKAMKGQFSLAQHWIAGNLMEPETLLILCL